MKSKGIQAGPGPGYSGISICTDIGIFFHVELHFAFIGFYIDLRRPRFVFVFELSVTMMLMIRPRIPSRWKSQRERRWQLRTNGDKYDANAAAIMANEMVVMIDVNVPSFRRQQ